MELRHINNFWTYDIVNNFPFHNFNKGFPVMDKLEHMWDAIGSYIVYAIVAAIALSVDVLEKVPGIGTEVSTVVEEAAELPKIDPVAVMDGHLLIYGMNLVDILQIVVLTLTGIVAAFKAYHDFLGFVRKKRYSDKR